MKSTLWLVYRLAAFISALFPAMFGSTGASAAEIALLAGYETSSDARISATNQWPPGNLPDGDPGETIDLDEGASWAVAFNTDFQNNPNQKIGLYYSRHDTAFDTTAGLADSALEVAFLHFVGTNIYPQSDRLDYFVLGGLGAAHYRPADTTLKNVTQFSFQLGVGANLRVTENLLLQADVRWLPTTFNGKTNIFCNGGCTIQIDTDLFNQFQVNAGVLFRF